MTNQELIERFELHGLNNTELNVFREEVLPYVGNTLFGFTGNDNCEEECDGWDGYSHRCKCGNRRVSWTCEGSGEDIFFRGEAH